MGLGYYGRGRLLFEWVNVLGYLGNWVGCFVWQMVMVMCLYYYLMDNVVYCGMAEK